MRYDKYVEYAKEIESYPVSQRKKLFFDIMSHEKGYTKVYTAARFEYAYCFFETGSFHKASKILEPIIIKTSEFQFVPEIIMSYFVMGIIAQYGGDYKLSICYFEFALKTAKQHKCVSKYFLCYNNIASSYGFEEKFEECLYNLNLAEEYLKSDNLYHWSMLYTNKTKCYIALKQYDKALECYDLCMNVYQAVEFGIGPLLYCAGVQLFRALGDEKRYQEAKILMLNGLEELPPSDSIAAYETILVEAMENDDTAMVLRIMDLSDKYLEENPTEYRMGLKYYGYKYEYAKKKQDLEGMLQALDKKNMYFDKTLEQMEKKNTEDISKEVRIHLLKKMNLETKKQNTQLKELSYTDSLTGVKNRHAFNVLLQGNNKLKKSQSTTYFIIDIDDFKSINDTYSHLEGDYVLRNIGAVLTEHVREELNIYRYGGDEFVGVMINTEYEDVLSILRVIRHKIMKIKYGDQKNVSCTIGVAHMDGQPDMHFLMTEADRRLYIGKKNKGHLISED